MTIQGLAIGNQSSGIQVEQDGRSVRVRIPVHAEEVSVHKRTVVYEEVDIKRELVEETAPTSSE